MRTTLKIIKIGNSRGIIIPIHILEKLTIKEGDLIEIEIKKINGNKNEY